MTPKTKNILINVLAVLAGIIIGSIVNMFIVNNSANVIPLPEGVDPNDVESIKKNIQLYEAKHYVMPFLAHALGTLVGAFLVAKFAASHNYKLALGIGFFFLLGGIAAASMIGTPLIPTAVDLVFAYLPMAWIGAKMANAN
ncbi:MAG: hypothetical protein KJP21_09825 [Bacteroidia bacterium]|nr:hypothetical protein [Bacteroidia bacterium]NNJ55659.1 hypothetical protein [Bacteroidia bacterium]